MLAPSATTGEEMPADGAGADDATAVGAGVDDGDGDGDAVAELVGAGTAVTGSVAVGAAVRASVGRGVGRAVGRGVDGARTFTIPNICSGWISQKYGNVPAAVNFAVKVWPLVSKPADAGWSGNRLSTAPGLPLVTVCGSLTFATTQVTWSPARIVRVVPPSGATKP